MHENVGLLYYHFHKIEMKRGESYIESPEQLKNKRESVNPKNEMMIIGFSILQLLQ